MSIKWNDIAKEANECATEKGFWEEEDIHKKYLRAIGEISYEAETALSENRRAMCQSGELTDEHFLVFVKDTFEDELADTVLRLLNIFHHHGYKVNDKIEEYKMTLFFDDDIREIMMRVVYCIVNASFRRYNTERHDILLAIANICGICDKMNIDLEWHLRAKLKYNWGRPKFHGKKN
jgi:NTP pyrophosphatase (non-canonical NTP hydrolase)